MNSKQEHRRTQFLVIIGAIFFIAFLITVGTNTPEAWRALSGFLALFIIAFLIYSSWCSWKNRGMSDRKCNWWVVGVAVFLWFIASQLSISGFSFDATKLSNSTAGYALDLADNWALAASAASANRTGETMYYAGLSDQKYKKLKQLTKSSEYKILNKTTSTCNDVLEELQGKTIFEAANAYEICAQAFRDAAGDVNHVKEIPVTPIPLGIITAGYFLDMANDLTLAKEATLEGRDYGYTYYTGLHEQKSNMIKELANRSEYATIGKAFQICEDAWQDVPYEASVSVRTDALEKCINAYHDAAGDVTHVKEIPFTPVPLGTTTAGYFLDLADDYIKAAEAAKVGQASAVMYYLAVLSEKQVILSDMMESGESIRFWNAFRICTDVMTDAPANSPYRVVDGLEICAQAYQDAAGDVTQIKTIPFTPVPLSATTAEYIIDMADDITKAAEAARSMNQAEFKFYTTSFEQRNGTIYDMTKSGEDVVIRRADLICEDAGNSLTDDSSFSDVADVLEICAQAYYDAAGVKQ